MFVDPVKQGLPKIFLSMTTILSNCWSPKAESEPTAPSSPYILRIVPNTYGFGMKYSLQFMSIHCSVNVVMSIGVIYWTPSLVHISTSVWS